MELKKENYMTEHNIVIAEHSLYEIRLTAVCCGKDLSVTVCGGTHPHIGAVCLACGILPDGSQPKYSATVNTITVMDHKDDVVARQLSARLADRLHAVVTVAAGIHIDNARPEELKILQENCLEASDRLLKELDK
jgi:hypothetical protein